MPENPEMILYYFPRACSLAAHIAIEESGYSYTRELVNIGKKENKDADYLALNPMGAIPTLSMDSWLLTETHSILTFIGDTAPNGPMLPPVGDQDRYRAHQLMNFLSSSVHTYIRSIFRPSAYTPENDQSAQASVKEKGHKNLALAVNSLEKKLRDTDWTVGNKFSVVDAYMFTMYLWSDDNRIESIPDRPKWAAIAERVWRRPAVRKVVAIEQQDRNFTIPF
ncbi:MAG: glutathione binding-like protein [Pseudomonadota bacterium]|nr:glutathione binding-like protein [Pseudomonadota bacterium]